MDTEVRLLPEQASDFAVRVDHLYFWLIGVTTFFTLLIFLLIFGFAIHYRRGARVDRSNPSHGNLAMEFSWAFAPFVIVMITFGWGARLYFEAYRPPPNSLDVYVVGKQWMWKLQHEEGKGEINELHVPVNTPVRLTMISEDVIHSFFIPALRVKQDVLPGRYTSLWFEANRPGVYHLFCAEYCGTSHAAMRGRVIVMEQHEYAQWISQPGTVPPAVQGQQVFERLRCGDCHTGRADGQGPPLHDLFVRPRTFADGQQLYADLRYVRESILEPQAKIVAGYQPIMPTFQAQITEEEILQLIAYLETLSAHPIELEVEP